MPIEGIQWSREMPAVEIHVLEGKTSQDLRVKHLVFLRRDANLNVVLVAAKAYLDDAANGGDVTVSFRIADASAEPGKSTRTFAAHGITLNATTGEVKAPVTLPAVFPRNFLLEVEAVSGTNKFYDFIRVHVHRSIKGQVWLTPNPLTVRPRSGDASRQTTPYMFALRAKFDDDVYGDITNWPRIEWSPSTHVTPDGKLRVAASEAGGPAITITARLLDFPSVPAATASMKVAAPWGTTPIEARLVPGGSTTPFHDKPFAIEAVPNVLFLPDGFSDPHREDFYAYVNALVAFLKTETLCKPYDLLRNSMNFWAAFVPSDKDGITLGSRSFLMGTSAGLSPWIVPVPKQRRPSIASGAIWATEDLVFEVGLPIPRDATTHTPKRTDGEIIAEWTTLFGPKANAHLPPEAEKRDGVLKAWRDLATSRLLDDVDTPLGVMSGAPRPDVLHIAIQLNPHRMTRGHMDDLLAAIRHDQVATSGLQLQKLWTNPRKRDYDLVCIVVPSNGREMNRFGYFTLGQPFPFDFPASIVGVNDFVKDPIVPRAKAFPEETRVFVHELSHSFDLGDEYGGTNDRPLFPFQSEYIDRAVCNLMSDLAVKRSGVVHGDEIKWRWPRIQWAAEVAEIVPQSATRFEIAIPPRYGFAFPVGKVVHLQFHDVNFAYRPVHFPEQSAYLVKLPLVSVPLLLERVLGIERVLVSVHPTAQFPYPASRTVAAADIPARFPAGSTLYCPTPAPAGAFHASTYPYAELLAKNVREWITFLKKPLSGAAESGNELPEIPDLTALVLPDSFSSLERIHIVGLYEGGSGNNLGLYHPTGGCMMNDEKSGSRFCHVCKYVLVDGIDVGKHYFLDQEYAKIYPQV